MKPQENYPRWLFIAFPALAMMLGWGLRGHIGGGPFGAMIPGAMVAICLGLLLKMPRSAISVLAVFGVIGIGLGGEMTYGQTLGFLRNPETVWWGTVGTTIKGAVWGMLGGTVLSLGFFFNRIKKKTLIIAFLLMMAGMIAGFKLINDPMVLYFSDPAKPRPESWAALLFGAITLLLFLKFKTDKNTFKTIWIFTIWGTIGGGLGFGLGGFWMVLGSHLPDVIFKSWWKAMEFTFGLLFGASLGIAAWISRNELKTFYSENPVFDEPAIFPIWKELLIVFITGIITYWFLPFHIESFVETSQNSSSFIVLILHELARIVSNYAFYGFLFMLVLTRYPQTGWQIAVTLTFCHAAIDLVRDYYPDTNTFSPFTMHFFWVMLMTSSVALAVSWFVRNKKSVGNLFLLLIWSCIAVSFLRMGINPKSLGVEGLSLCQIICGRFIVDIFFVVSAVAVSLMLLKRFNRIEANSFQP